MEKKNKKELSKKFWIILIVVCFILIVVIALGFIKFNKDNQKVITKTKSGGTVSLKYTSNVNGLSIVGAIPTAEAIAIADMTEGKYFDFSVNIDFDSAKEIEYEVSVLKDDTNSTISNDDIRIYLEKEDNGTYSKQFGPEKYTPLQAKTSLGTKKGSMLIIKDKATKSRTDYYRLRMWLSDTSLLETGNYSVTVEVIGKAK